MPTIIRLRTQDRLTDLVRHRLSGVWIVSKETERRRRVLDVEIVNWDGTKMITAGIDWNRTFRNPNDTRRLFIGLDNPVIVDSNVIWVGQNPVNYIQR